MTATNKKMTGLCHRGVHSSCADMTKQSRGAMEKAGALGQNLGLQVSSARYSMGPWTSARISRSLGFFICWGDEHTYLRALSWGFNTVTNMRWGLGTKMPPNHLLCHSLSHQIILHRQGLAGVSSPPTDSTEVGPKLWLWNALCRSYKPHKEWGMKWLLFLFSK